MYIYIYTSICVQLCVDCICMYGRACCSDSSNVELGLKVVYICICTLICLHL